MEKVEAKDIRRTYEGFEIGSHGANHDGFVGLSEENLRRVILRDIDIYSAYSDRPVVCSAYPGGQTDAETISKLHRLRVVKFARGVPDGKISFNRFEEEMDILPQAHMFDKDVYDIIDAFENTKNDDINILHIYGHSYEADLYENGWENIEMLLRRLSGTDAEKLCNGEAYAAAFRRKYVCPE